MANTKKNQYLRRSKPKKIIGGVPPPTEPPSIQKYKKIVFYIFVM